MYPFSSSLLVNLKLCCMVAGSQQVVIFQADGRMAMEQVEVLAELAIGGSQAVGQAMRNTLLDNTRTLALARGPVRL